VAAPLGVYDILRIVAVILAERAGAPQGRRCHPLAHPLVAHLSATYTPDNVTDGAFNHLWTFHENVKIPTKILITLGVDIFSDPDFSQETIHTIMLRLGNNADESATNLTPGRPRNLVSIHPNYIFFNHSCENNVEWTTAGTIEKFLQLSNGSITPGMSAVWCHANRDIKAGEECKITYIAVPMGRNADHRIHQRLALRAWVGDRGCGCSVCEWENAKMDESDQDIDQ
jgi:hypothetical protein